MTILLLTCLRNQLARQIKPTAALSMAFTNLAGAGHSFREEITKGVLGNSR